MGDNIFEERIIYHWQRFASGLAPAYDQEWPGWLDEYKLLKKDAGLP